MTPNRSPARPATAAALLLPLAALLLAGCADGGTAAETVLEVRFGGRAPDVDATVRSDLDGRPTAARYAADGIPHPDGYTAHDQLEDWSRAGGLPYAATPFNGSFGAGYFLSSIGGVAADGSAYWAFAVNGAPSPVGMSEAVLRAGDRVTWTYTPMEADGTGDGASGSGPAGPAGSSSGLDPSPLGATVDPPAPTRGETAVVTGSVNQPARVSLDGGPAADVPAGRWELITGPLPHGRTESVVRIEDGVHSVAVPVTFVRLASATVEAVYTAHPLHEDTSHAVWYDPDSHPSAPEYEGRDAPRASGFTVHDLLVAWTAQHGVQVGYTYSDAFGFGVESIDGVGNALDSGAPPWWCYAVDGASASLGISLQEVAPGVVVTWEYGACA